MLTKCNNNHILLSRVKKMKKYVPEKLVAISRYKTLFPTLSPDIQKDVYDRMAVLLEEEKQWCDKGNYKHIAQILTTIALYEVRHDTDAGNGWERTESV